MKPLEISKDFTIEDIHKIREYHYEMTKNMRKEEKDRYYDQRQLRALEMQKRIDELRRKRSS